ncbi:MAG: hypothetical protein SynsKO_33110 [Synoicihabitans sp.]
MLGQAPQIIERPLSQIAVEGEALNFTVTATGTEPLTYTWQHNGTPLAETSDTLTLDSASLSDSGWYHVTVSNDAGAATSVFMIEVGLPESAFALWGEFYESVPQSFENVVDLASGFDSYTLLALEADGSVLAWGGFSQGQASVPDDLAPAVRIATNTSTSAAVTATGQVVEWPTSGNLPSGLSNVVDVELGRNYGLLLNADGTVVSWGENFNGQRDIPHDLENVVGIVSGIGHSAALIADGTVRAWGGGPGALNLPSNLEDVVALTGGSSHLIARLRDGSVVAWGNNYADSSSVPSGLPPISEIAAGGNFNLMRQVDGSVSGFGSNYQSQIDIPNSLSNTFKLVTGFGFSGALIAPTPPQIEINPVSQSIENGDDLILSVTPTGTIPFTYQWFRDNEALQDGDNVEGANTNELYISDVTVEHAGDYRVEISNRYATVSSPPATVVVAASPVFTTRPLTCLLDLGGSTTFAADVYSTESVTYMWKHNGQIIEGANSATHTIGGATTHDGGIYEIIAENSQGANSSVFHVHITPSIPGERTLRFWGSAFHQQDDIPTGATDIVKLVVHDDRALALHADGTLSGWGSQSFDTAPPAGLSDVVDIAAGPYASAALTASGRVVNWGGYFEQNWAIANRLTDVVSLSASSMHLLAVKNDGTIWSSLGDQAEVSTWTQVVSAHPHNNGVYGIRRDGTLLQTSGPINEINPDIPQPSNLQNLAQLATERNYAIARFRDGSIAGWGNNSYNRARPPQSVDDAIAINSDYVLHSDGLLSEWRIGANSLDSPIYDLADVLAFDSHSGFGVAVVVARAPVFPTPDESITANVGKSMTLAPPVRSGPNTSYQWIHNGENIEGATSPTLQLNAINTDSSGEYVLQATNAYGTNSARTSVQVVPPVDVIKRPLSRMISTGDATTFDITATGQGDLQYEWRHNGKRIHSATGSSLTINNATRDDRGRYETLITDSFGGTAFSIVYLEVAPPVGALIGWGFDNAPLPGAPHNFAAIAASGSSGIGLRADGTVSTWAFANFPPPENLDNVVAVAKGQNYALGLHADGTVTAWPTYQYTTPPAVPSGLDNVVAIAANRRTNLALRADGTVIAWTGTSNKTDIVPDNLDEVVSIGAGIYQAMALKRDNSVVSWGTLPIDVYKPVHDIAAGWSNVLLKLNDGNIEFWQSGSIDEFKTSLHLAEVRAMSVGSDQALMVDGEYRLHSTNPTLVDPDMLTLENVLDVASGQDCHAVLVGAAPAAPSITIQPQSQTIPYGSNGSLVVEAAGTPILQYQWFKNNSPLANETGPVLELNNVQENASALYTVEISNGFGTVTSEPAELTVHIVRVTPDAPAVAGGSVTLSVNAPDATTYQWRFLGTPISGATNSTLTLNNLSRAQNGFYDVVITESEDEQIAHAHRLQVSPSRLPEIMVADPDFHPRFEREGLVDIHVVMPLPDGSFLVGGDFTAADNLPIAYLARFFANGTLDSNYHPPVLNGAVRAIHVADDGSVYIGGDFTTASGQLQGRLLRLKANLDLDRSFAVGKGFEDAVFVITTDEEGRILVGGELGYYHDTWVNGIARLNPDGELETPIGARSYADNVRAIHLLEDGKLMIAGGSIDQTNGFVARINADGTPDTTWSSYNGEISTGRTVYQLHPSPDGGWYVVGGYMGDLSPTSGVLLRKLNADATWANDSFELDRAFSQSPLGLTVSTMLPNGRLLVGGPFIRPTIIDPDGSTVGDVFPFQPWVIPSAFTTRSDATVQVWAQVSSPEGTHFGKAELDPDHSPATDFTRTTFRRNALVYHALQTTPETVLLRGEFTHVNGTLQVGLVQMTSEGEIDPSFTPATALPLYDSGPMIMDGRQRILLHNGSQITRLLQDGSNDSSFATPGSNPGALTLTPNGDILVSNHGYNGNGTHFGDQSYIYRLNDDGSIDTDFSVDFSGTIRSAATSSTGLTVLGGRIQSMESTFTSGLQRVSNDGTWDRSYQTPDYNYSHFTPGPGDSLFLVGEYHTDSLRKLNKAGEEFPDFDYYGQPEAVSIIPLASGGFYRITPAKDPNGAHHSDLLGRHQPDGSLDTDFHVDGIDVGSTNLSEFILQDDGSFWLLGENLSLNGSPLSGVMRVIPAEPLTIVTLPESTTAELGRTTMFRVETTGSGPITYQWFRNKVAIEGETSSTLVLSDLTLADSAQYWVEVVGPFETLRSDPVTLTGLNPPPTITESPTSLIAYAGHSATLSVEAAGVGNLTYQWRRFGEAIPGANQPTFTILNSSLGDEGLYDVVIADGLSTVTSETVQIDVAPRAYPGSLEVDPSFEPQLETEGGSINAILSAPGDKFIISGAFSRLNGVRVPGLARVDANFQVDSSYQPPAGLSSVLPYTSVSDMAVRARLVLPDGKLLVTRPLPYDADNGQRNEIIRLLSNGTRDNSFSAPVGPRFIQKIALQPDGKIIVMGTGPTDSTSSNDQRVYRLNYDGSVDDSFSPTFTRFGENKTPFGLTVQPNGKVVFVGDFDSVNGSTVSRLARLNSDGSRDSTFSTAGYSLGVVRSITSDPDGHLWLGGYVYDSAGRTSHLTKLEPDGEWDRGNFSFPFPGSPFNDFQWGPDGKLWVANQNGSGTLIVWRMSAAGGFESVVVPSASTSSPAFAPLADGSAWVGEGDKVVRYLASGDGNHDAPIAQTNHPAGVSQMAHGPSGTIYIVGEFTAVNGVDRHHIARLLPTGELDPNFNPGSGFDTNPTNLVVTHNGGLYVGGNFSRYDGKSVPPIVLLKPDGTLDPSFSIQEPEASYWNGGPLTLLKDGRLLVDGHRCFLPDGSVDSTFYPNNTTADFVFPTIEGGVLLAAAGQIIQLDSFGQEVTRTQSGFARQGMDLLPDGRVYLGGVNPAGGNNSNDAIVSRLLPPDYRNDPEFNSSYLPRRNGSLYPYFGANVLAQEDGRVILWDNFSMLRLNSDGAIDTSFQQLAVEGLAQTFSEPAATALLLSDGRMLIADQDMVVGGFQHKGLVALSNTNGVIITDQPKSRNIIEGDILILDVTIANSTGLTYQWFKDGEAVVGATNTTLEISSVGPEDVGAYSLTINSPLGPTRSEQAVVTLTPESAPIFTLQPRDQSVATGATITLTAAAFGAPLPTYQWKRDGVNIPGATETSLTLSDITPADSGNYTLMATNRRGSAMSDSARITVFPSGMSATQTLRGATMEDGVVRIEISNHLSSSGNITRADWQVLAPPGWSFISSSGDSDTSVRPSTNDADLLEWSWTSDSFLPLDFDYTIQKSGNPAHGDALVTLLTVTMANGTTEFLVQPDPLPLRVFHSADTNRDNRLSLSELLRVIELYNTRSGSIRTGKYETRSDSVDGFDPGPDDATSLPVYFHSADTNRDGSFGLGELLRVIEIYNTRTGSIRTGRYRLDKGSVDGFEPEF